MKECCQKLRVELSSQIGETELARCEEREVRKQRDDLAAAQSELVDGITDKQHQLQAELDRNARQLEKNMSLQLKNEELSEQRDELAAALREVIRRKGLCDDGDDALTYLFGAIQDAAALKSMEKQ